jgi:tetratricopeptide (TPR) repeat protein
MAQAEDDRLPKYRWLIRTGVILGLLLVLAISAFFLYRRHEPDRLADRAREYFDKGDYRQAVLTARRALQINPSNQSASRLMVEITEALQVPDALDWRRRLAELNPGSSPEALAFAGSALRMGNTAAASQALSSVPESQQNTGSYHASAGMVAMGNGRFEDAGKHFAEALKLEPENELHRYNLATFQIQSRDHEQRKTGLATLAKLAEGGRVQVFARRAMIKRLISMRSGRRHSCRAHHCRGIPPSLFPTVSSTWICCGGLRSRRWPMPFSPRSEPLWRARKMPQLSWNGSASLIGSVMRWPSQAR